MDNNVRNARNAKMDISSMIAPLVLNGKFYIFGQQNVEAIVNVAEIGKEINGEKWFYVVIHYPTSTKLNIHAGDKEMVEDILNAFRSVFKQLSA